MAISIGSTIFDNFEGEVQPDKFRVDSFVRTDVANVGAQVLPTSGQQFEITTERYESSSTQANNLKAVIDASIGSIVAISADGVAYSSPPYSTRFLIISATHRRTETLVRARGYRLGAVFNYSPAKKVITVWRLQATP